MNGTQTGVAPGAQPLRVRDQARDVLALMVFTAAASGACSLAFLLLLVLGE
ncbi:hypothetical protein [Nocardioides jishulii]|uniref:hypothetical protein n=1 Tax=Nocardioides jishulii TaxID=2575440 RepID=UPI00148504D4|nr:hypothetical protein [Nocardioides jishulii]